MKNTLLILFAVITGTLVAVCVIQWQKHDVQKSELTSLRGEVEQKTRAVADAQAQQKHAEMQKREILEQASDLAGKLQTQRLASAKAEAKVAAALAATQSRSPGKGPAGFGDAFTKMMEDPEMLKMIRDQQRTMMDSLYSPLVKKMNLTPEEAGQLKDLIADNAMKGASKATSLFGGGSSTNRTEMLNVLSAEQKSFEQQVKEFLGESRYAEYKDYQQTVGERMQLNQFRQQTAGGENALTDQQIEQLLAFMREEKQTLAAATGLPMSADKQEAANLKAMLSDEGLQKLLQAQETLSQRVYERATSVLSESQLAAFARFQTNQLQMMRVGMNMARKLMPPEETRPATP